MSLRALGSLLATRETPQSAGGWDWEASTLFEESRRLWWCHGCFFWIGRSSVPLYFNKDDTANSSDAEATGEETGKEIVEEPYMSREKAIKAGFVRKDGKINWPEYFDYVNSQTNYGGMPLYDKDEYAKEVSGGGEAAVKLEDVEVDEAAMKARFEDWMKEYGRTYWTKKEKARRYEIFKDTAMSADKFNASKRSGARVAAPNGFADRTDEECKCCSDNHFDWETYVDHINFMAANGWYIGREELAAREAAKQRSRSARQAQGRCEGPKT